MKKFSAWANRWATKTGDLVLIIGIGIFLRARIILRDDFWFDEAFVGHLMRAGKEAFWQNILTDPHPPLYAFILKVWTYIFGINDLTLRGFSLLLGIATIYLLYLLGKELFNKETGLIAAFLAAISPFLIDYSVEARSYSLFAFFTILTIYFLVRKKYNLFVLGVLLMLSTHFVSTMFIPFLMLYYLYLCYKEKRLKIGLVHLGVIVAAIVLTYLFLISGKEQNLNDDWIRKSSLINLPRSATAYLYGIKSKKTGADELNDYNFPISQVALGSGVFVLFTIGTLVLLYKKRHSFKEFEKHVLPIVLVLGPQVLLILYGIYSGQSIYVERYLTPSAVFFCLGLAVLLNKFFRFETKAILILFYIFTLTKVETPDYYKGMKELAVSFRRFPETIVFTSPIDFVVGKYYFETTGAENTENMKLYNPERPDLSYFWWPFIEDSDKAQTLEGAMLVTPENERLDSLRKDFALTKSEQFYDDYMIFWISGGN